MSSFGAPDDSFQQFDRLYSLLFRPLSEVQKICGGFIINFKYTLGDHIQALKGEIRKNCQAHSKRKDAEIYLRSIKSKLKEDLLNHLMGKEVDSDYHGNPIYHTTDRTPRDEEFINEIMASFSSLFKYIDELISMEVGKSFGGSRKEEKYRKTSHPAAYSLTPSVKEAKFLEAFHLLKGKFISEDTSDEQFWTCFSGKPVPEKVKWERQNALTYFISELNRRELIEKIPNGIWETAALCFFNKKGESLDPGNLGRTKSPSLAKCREIDNAIDIIKKTRE